MIGFVKRLKIGKMRPMEMALLKYWSRMSTFAPQFAHCFISPEHVYIITENLPPSLLDLDTRGAFRSNTANRRLKFYGDVAKALEEMHGLGIMHGDIFSGNVLIDEYRKPYLIDLGFSQFLDYPDNKRFQLLYMNPERTLPDAVNTPFNDVYSLAMLIAMTELPSTSKVFDMKGFNQARDPVMPEKDRFNMAERIVEFMHTEAKWEAHLPEDMDLMTMNLTTIIYRILVKLDKRFTTDVLFKRLYKLAYLAERKAIPNEALDKCTLPRWLEYLEPVKDPDSLYGNCVLVDTNGFGFI